MREVRSVLPRDSEKEAPMWRLSPNCKPCKPSLGNGVRGSGHAFQEIVRPHSDRNQKRVANFPLPRRTDEGESVHDSSPHGIGDFVTVEDFSSAKKFLSPTALVGRGACSARNHPGNERTRASVALVS